MALPRWKRGDGSDRIGNHCYAESILEREVHGVLQVIERIKIREMVTADARPTYRLVEVRGAKPTIVGFDDLLKDARGRADRRAS